jgi:hypothetical protein
MNPNCVQVPASKQALQCAAVRVVGAGGPGAEMADAGLCGLAQALQPEVVGAVLEGDGGFADGEVGAEGEGEAVVREGPGDDCGARVGAGGEEGDFDAERDAMVVGGDGVR